MNWHRPVERDESRAKAEILRKAIVLYELAYRASLKNPRLGVFDEDERLVTEIVGV